MISGRRFFFLPSPSPLSFFRPRTHRKGYYFYSPQSSTVIKSKMAATTITRTKFRPPKIRLHCRLIAHQCCDQLTAVKTGYLLTSINWPYRGLKCRPIEVEYFLKLSTDKLPVSNNRRLKFIFSNDSYEICCVYVTMTPHCQDFDFKLTLDANIQPFFKKIQAGRPSLTMVTRWSLCPIFVLCMIGQNLAGEFMRKIYAAS